MQMDKQIFTPDKQMTSKFFVKIFERTSKWSSKFCFLHINVFSGKLKSILYLCSFLIVLEQYPILQI